MAMGIVSDHDFYVEKEKILPPDERDKSVYIIPTSPNESNSSNDIKKERGRGKDNVEVPNSIRNLIAQTALESGRPEALELAKHLGISPSSVSAYTHGATSTASYDERPNLPVINKTKEKITKRARVKLMAAMRHITEDKLKECKAVELSTIARNMSTVVTQMEPESVVAEDKKPGPTFVFYSPNIRKEEVFDLVQAKE